MNESTTALTKQFTGCATLAAIGIKLRDLKVFEPIEHTVQIAQKTIKDSPSDKLYDALISLLAGAHGLVEINTRLRADAALQRAFGRSRCAEQSVVQDTLNACTAQNVEQMEQAMDMIYRQHSQGKRSRTIVRVDAGGGSLDDVNWLLARDYQVHCKDYSGKQAARLAKSVQHWFADPHQPERQFGWVTELSNAYVRPVKRIAVRCRQQDGKFAYGVLISTLSAQHVLGLTGQPLSSLDDPAAVLLASVTFYDQRGGGVETSFKGDRQGLGIGKRSKKRFAAQQVVMLLGSLAHNVIVWARHWLASPSLHHYGTLRMVRDVFHISGFLLTDAFGQVVQLVLNQAAPLAAALVHPLRELLACAQVAVNLGQT